MSTQESTNSLVRHSRRYILAGLFCSGLLGMPQIPEHAARSDDSGFVPVSQHGPEISPDTTWSQIPLESRELWKFRLTRTR